MRHSHYILLCAAALLLLAGCQKTGMTGREVRFTVVSQERPQTKTNYTGEVDNTSRKERIDWVAGDLIRIYSDHATCNNANTYHWADYQIRDVSASGYQSTAEIDATDATTGGLAWTDETSYDFYGIYPSPGSFEDAETVRGTSSNPFPCSISATQEGTATDVAAIGSGASTTVYYPSMANAYLVAHASATKDTPITLPFEPAYTAFHISAGAPTDEDVTISSVTLTSRGDGSTALAGAYSAYISGSDWTYGITGTDKTVTFTFDGGDKTIEKKTKVEFVIFALPQTLKNLTLTFNMGDGTTHNSLKLKYSASAGGAFIDFAPCKKHYIKGLLIPGSTWTIDDNTDIILRESVAPWDNSSQELVYGESGNPVVNASKLNYNTSTNTGSFAIYAPVGATWRIKALNASDDSPATGVTLTQTNSDPAGKTSTYGVLEGTVGSPSIIEFTVTGPAGTYKLDFSIVIESRAYSINSEIRFNDSIVLS